ncbi:TetR/AcrR family transcriptional regulator [Amycolatopsis sp. TNS106]|uniref:TetR/AcrR family transcriptional regulator n=1 Tax=Amycolatopsis sp. TNS106 TaxID=2861750 RepID=UPI001C59008C|nr:TetR/AcrR family transcriptional regulator [Amycolatopsis sp. TNS106]QXV56970.1 TetR family transcriptional regulator [Amycolatopsis sp. TNS106]
MSEDLQPDRRRKRNSAATKEAILQAAMKLFVDRGFDAATVRDIADLAGVNQALLFRYFGSKEELFDVAVSRRALAQLDETPPDRLIEVILRELLAVGPGAGSDQIVKAILLSTGQPGTVSAGRKQVRDGYTDALATLSGAPDARLRASLLLAWLLGIGIARHITEDQNIVAADFGDICAVVTGVAKNLLAATSSPRSDGDRA